MNMMEIESAARFAWPALEEEELSFGVLRYARGTDRRSNSLSLYPEAAFDEEKLIGVTEKFFAERNAAPIVRILQPIGGSLDALKRIDHALALRGYEKQAPTLSMLLDLEKFPIHREKAAIDSIKSSDVRSWLEAWYGLTQRSPRSLCIHETLLETSSLSSLCLLRKNTKNETVSSGMAVGADQALGLFGIATALEQRNKGYAREVIESLLQWGVKNGKKFAYLQVEESNHAAVTLYRKLGFEKSYSYWYRVGKQQKFGRGD